MHATRTSMSLKASTDQYSASMVRVGLARLEFDVVDEFHIGRRTHDGSASLARIPPRKIAAKVRVVMSSISRRWAASSSKVCRILRGSKTTSTRGLVNT